MSKRALNAGTRAENRVEEALKKMKNDPTSGVLDFRRTTTVRGLKALDSEGVDFLIYLEPIEIHRGNNIYSVGGFLIMPLQVKNSAGKGGKHIKAHYGKYPHIIAIAVGKSSTGILVYRIKKQIRKALRGKRIPRS